ncbi:beta-1,3-galactosyl-O-glycosyl-glycoprotein beta-1,6-N-acetylglucosaminyltransferase-like [Tachysurus ichikawai]
MVARIIQEKRVIKYRSLMFGNDESPEDKCDCNKILQGPYTALRIFYCIHVDKKAPHSTRKVISGIVSCFDNVFLVSQTVEVVYASWSRVQADINCMKDLYQVNSHWKYFINLCGQDFPIKTNLEIVRMLKKFGGATVTAWRLRPHPVLRDSDGSKATKVPKAQVLISWLNDTYSPDEFLWATLQRRFLRAHFKFDITDVYSISQLIKYHVFMDVFFIRHGLDSLGSSV